MVDPASFGLHCQGSEENEGKWYGKQSD